MKLDTVRKHPFQNSSYSYKLSQVECKRRGYMFYPECYYFAMRLKKLVIVTFTAFLSIFNAPFSVSTSNVNQAPTFIPNKHKKVEMAPSTATADNTATPDSTMTPLPTYTPYRTSTPEPTKTPRPIAFKING